MAEGYALPGLAAARRGTRYRFALPARSSYSEGSPDAGWSSSVARWAHNPEVEGSNPSPATKMQVRGPLPTRMGPLACGLCTALGRSGRSRLSTPDPNPSALMYADNAQAVVERREAYRSVRNSSHSSSEAKSPVVPYHPPTRPAGR